MAESAIDKLNGCLRGEISAAETYRMALDELGDAHAPEAKRLKELQRHHGEAAQELRARVRELGGEADDDSGAWGAFAKSVQGAADLFGDAAALKSIKEGEEYGVKLYEDALTDQSLDPQTRRLVARLEMQQRRHVEELDMLLQAV